MKTFCNYCRKYTETITLTEYSTQFCDVCCCQKKGKNNEQHNNSINTDSCIYNNADNLVCVNNSK